MKKELAPATLRNLRNWRSLRSKLCGVLSYQSLSPGLLLLCFFCVQSRAYSETALPKVVMGSATVAEYGEFNASFRALESTTCNDPSRYFGNPMMVGDFVGGNVRGIHIVHYLRHKPAKTDELRKLIKSVWRGRFQSASCSILWSEGVLWSIECTLEFKDGKQGMLTTDGTHVALRDHEGKDWFLRLLPAAQ